MTSTNNSYLILKNYKDYYLSFKDNYLYISSELSDLNDSHFIVLNNLLQAKQANQVNKITDEQQKLERSVIVAEEDNNKFVSQCQNNIKNDEDSVYNSDLNETQSMFQPQVTNIKIYNKITSARKNIIGSRCAYFKLNNEYMFNSNTYASIVRYVCKKFNETVPFSLTGSYDSIKHIDRLCKQYCAKYEIGIINKNKQYKLEIDYTNNQIINKTPPTSLNQTLTQPQSQAQTQKPPAELSPILPPILPPNMPSLLELQSELPPMHPQNTEQLLYNKESYMSTQINQTAQKPLLTQSYQAQQLSQEQLSRDPLRQTNNTFRDQLLYPISRERHSSIVHRKDQQPINTNQKQYDTLFRESQLTVDSQPQSDLNQNNLITSSNKNINRIIKSKDNDNTKTSTQLPQTIISNNQFVLDTQPNNLSQLDNKPNITNNYIMSNSRINLNKFIDSFTNDQIENFEMQYNIININKKNIRKYIIKCYKAVPPNQYHLISDMMIGKSYNDLFTYSQEYNVSIYKKLQTKEKLKLFIQLLDICNELNNYRLEIVDRVITSSSNK